MNKFRSYYEQKAQAAIDALEEAVTELETAIGKLDEAVE